jgi:hypothetical protein
VTTGRVISFLPPGELHVSWYDRRQREGVVVFVPDPRPPAHNDAYFRKAIPEWRRLGIATDLHVYEADG